jgi:hypothetical protein
MATFLEIRLAALEQRVRALEARIHDAEATTLPAAPPDAAHPALAAPAWTPRLPRPIPRRERAARSAGDFEAWLGGVVLARVGIAAVVLAAAYFAQLAYRHVGHEAKVLSLYALAGALAAVGGLLRKRAAPRFVGLLWGGATAVAYVAGVAATLRYELVSPLVGLALVTGAAALGTWFARLLKVEAIGSLSLVSAFAAPIVLRVVGPHEGAMLVYAAGLGLWGALAERLFGWRTTRVLGLLGTLVLAATATVQHGWHDAAHFAPLLATLTAVLLPDVVAGLRGRDARLGVRITQGILLVAAGLASLGVPHDSALDWLGQWIGPCGLLWSGLALALGLWARAPGAPRLAGLLGAVGGLALVHGAALLPTESALLWEPAFGAAGVAALLVALGRVTGARDLALTAAAWLAASLAGSAAHVASGTPGPALEPLQATVRVALALVPAALLALHGATPWGRACGLLLGVGALLAAFLEPAVRHDLAWLCLPTAAGAALLTLAHARAAAREDALPAGTATTLLVLGACGWTALVLYPIGRSAGLPAAFDHVALTALVLAGCAWAVSRRESRLATQDPAVVPILSLAAVALVLAAGGREVFLLTRSLEGAGPKIALTLYLVLAGAGAVAAGFRIRLALLRWVGLGLFAAAVVKVGLVDLAHASLPLRVLVTGVLGLVLLGAAYGYARRRRGESPDACGPKRSSLHC